jgi:cell division protein FtsL
MKEWNKKSIKKKSNIILVFTFSVIIAFVILFTYSSLNLKNIDYGYKMQELIKKEKLLIEEIDRLKSEKSSLLNLSRVEKIVMNKLGYKYPKPEQFIKVFEGVNDSEYGL